MKINNKLIFAALATCMTIGGVQATPAPTLDSNSGFSFSEAGSLNPSYSVTIQEITGATQTYYDKTTGNVISAPTSNSITINTPTITSKYYDIVTNDNANWASAKLNITDYVGSYTNYTHFKDLVSDGGGGALYYSKTGSTLSINSDFLYNEVDKPAGAGNVGGGALWNAGNLSIKGDFIGNRVVSKDTSGNVDFLGFGGAISNVGTIENLEAGFYENHAGGYNSRGGAIRNHGNGVINSISGIFQGNYIESTGDANSNVMSYGGALMNETNIGTIKADFIGNKATAVKNGTGTSAVCAYGGALANLGSAKIDLIEGDFINNNATGGWAKGGAMWVVSFSSANKSNIGKVIGDFVGNTATGETDASGGAIFANTATFGDGSFENSLFFNNSVKATADSSKALGGALYLENVALNDLKNVIFYKNIANATRGTTRGGAIYLAKDASINDISGSFISNTVTDYSSAAGGAIYNNGGKIGNINADFIDNFSNAGDGKDKTSIGGAIANTANGTIGNITGSFLKNRALYGIGGAIANVGDDVTIGTISDSTFSNNSSVTNAEASGGAIANIGENATINGIINSNFSNNSVSSYDGTTVRGGAIANIGENASVGTILNTSFTSNRATNSSGDAYGGAIYTDADLTVRADGEGKESLFSANYVNSNGKLDNNAIYVGSADATLTLDAINSGKIQMNDNIKGADGYGLALSGDSTGTIVLNSTVGTANATLTDATLQFKANTFADANLDAQSGTLNMLDYVTTDYEIKQLTSNANANYKIDLNFYSKTSDTLTVGEGSTGVINISDINYIFNKPNTSMIFKILNGNENIQLSLSEELKNQTFDVGSEILHLEDDLTTTMSYTDKFYYYDQTAYKKGNIELAKTDTTNDSLKWDIKTVLGDKFNQVSKGDSLALLNTMVTDENRNFNFVDDGVNKYTVSTDLGVTSAGTLNINGVEGSNGLSEIDANSHNLFDLRNDTNLNVENVKFTNATNGILKTSESNNIVANFNNVDFSNNDSTLFDLKTGTVTITKGKFNSSAGSTVIKNDGGSLILIDPNLYNMNQTVKDYIVNNSNMTIKAKDATLWGTAYADKTFIKNDGTLNFDSENGNSVILAYSIYSDNVGKINVLGNYSNIAPTIKIKNQDITIADTGVYYVNSDNDEVFENVNIDNYGSFQLGNNFNSGKLITRDSSQTTLFNDIQVGVNIEGNGALSVEGGSSVTLTGDNSGFNGDVSVDKLGTLNIVTDNINKIFDKSNITLNGAMLNYKSSQNSTTDAPIILDSNFGNVIANVAQDDNGNNLIPTVSVTGNGAGNSVYSINDGWLSIADSASLNFNNAKYILNSSFGINADSTKNNFVNFNDSYVTIGDSLKSGTVVAPNGENVDNFDMGGSSYTFSNSTIDLIDKVAGNDYKFKDITLNGDTKLALDVNLFYDENQKPYADTITAESGSGLATITKLFITDDNGKISSANDKGIIQIFKGNNTLQVAPADNLQLLSWATNVYKYDIESATTDHASDSIRIVPKGISSSDTLRDLNLYKGNRGFNFIAKDGLQANNRYNIYRDLDNTNEGIFSIIGTISQDEGKKSVLDGTLQDLKIEANEVGARLVQEDSKWYYYEPDMVNKTDVTDYVSFDSEGNASISPSAFSNNTNGSMFELVSATDFEITNVSIENAFRGENSAISDGAAIYANNADANIKLSSVDFVNNRVSGNGGAIANELSKTFVIENTAMKNNTASNNGGAIYNTADSMIIAGGAFDGNSALTGNGGAIYTSADLIISDSDFGKDDFNYANGVLNDIYIAGAKVLFNTSTDKTSYIMSGLAGDGSFIKEGEGTLELSGVNKDLTGDFIVNKGTVNYNGDLESHSFVGGNVKIADNTTLALNSANGVTTNIKNVSNVNNGDKGNLLINSKDGYNGNVNLSGDNSGFTGDMKIQNGKLSYVATNTTERFVGGNTEIANGATLGLYVKDDVDNQTVMNIRSAVKDATSNAKIEVGSDDYTGSIAITGDNSEFFGNVSINNGTLVYKAENDSDLYVSGKTTIAQNGTLKVEVAQNVTGQKVGNIDGNGKFVVNNNSSQVDLVGTNSGFSGQVDITSGTLAYEKTDLDTFFGTDAKISIADAGTLKYTVNDGNAILNAISGYTDGGVTTSGTLVKEGNGSLNISGDNSNFNGLVDINTGNLVYSTANGLKLFGSDTRYDIASGASLDIKNTDDVALGNLIGEGTVNKSENGKLTLNSDNSVFNGLLNIENGKVSFTNDGNVKYISGETKIASGATLDYIADVTSALTKVSGTGDLNYSGNEELTFNAVDNSKFKGNAFVNGKQLNVTGAKLDDFDFNITVNDGKLSYTSANENTNITLSNASKVKFGSENANASAQFNGGTYTIAGDLQNVNGNNLIFDNNSTLKLSTANVDKGNYTVRNSIIDLANNAVEKITFANLTTDNAELKIDVNFKAPDSHMSDVLVATNGGGTLKIAITGLNITEEKEDGLNSTHRINVLGGGLTFDGTNSIGKWATSAYTYDVKTDNQDLILTAIKASTDNSLKEMNDTEGTRGFQFTTQDDDPYVIRESLGTTADGIFTVNGVSGGSTTISGAGTKSFFEVTGNTDLRINDLTISNSNGTQGSAILADNADAKVTLNNVNIINGSSTGNGGVINNTSSSIFEITNGEMTGNIAGGRGGAIYTKTGMTITDTNFSGNTDSAGANDIYFDGENAILRYVVNGTSNISSGIAGDGSLNKFGNGTLNLAGNNKDFSGNLNIVEGDVIFMQNDASDTFISGNTGIGENASLNLTNNLSDISAGNVRGTGSLIKDGEKSLTLTGDNSGFGGNFDIKKGDVIFDADNDKYISGSTNISSDGALKVSNNSDFVVPTISGTGLLDKDGSGNLILIGDNTGFNGDLTVRNGGFALGAGSKISGLHSGTFENDTTINLQNTNIVDLGNGRFSTSPNPPSLEDLYFDDLTINGITNLKIDVDLKNSKSDKIGAGTFTGGHLLISNGGLNAVSDAIVKNTQIEIAYGALAEGDNIILGSDAQTVMGPIQKYDVTYKDGYLSFVRQGGSTPGIGSVNMGIMASPVATQVGGYLTQLETLRAGFFHMDRYSKYPRMLRMTAEQNNKYAITDTPVFRDTMLPETSQSMWVKPYTSFEKVNLRGGINVSNVTYGTLYGGDSRLVDLGHGYKGVLSAFIGYNGSHQSFNGISMNHNGGTLGATGTLYKGNFFTGLTVSTGASAGEAYTSFGTDRFSMLTAGIASRTGYNWEIKNGRLIIQPNLFVGYTFVNTFDYTNAKGIKMDSDPLHAVQIVPGLKVIGNLKNGWQPYLGVNMVWNIMGSNKVMANDVRLPQLSVKPYVEYGVGVQKNWSGRLTAFFQTMLRSGGRNGVALSAGLTWKLGKSPERVDKGTTVKKVIKSTNTVKKSSL